MRISDWSSDVCSSDLTAGVMAHVEVRIQRSYQLLAQIVEQIDTCDETDETVRVGNDRDMALREYRHQFGNRCVGAYRFQRGHHCGRDGIVETRRVDRKSTRMNSSH